MNSAAVDGNTLAKDLRHMVDETDQFLKSAARQGDGAYEEMRERLATQVRQFRAQMDDLEDLSLAKAKRAARLADQSVHDHPYSAMGVAAAAGLLLGFLVARR